MLTPGCGGAASPVQPQDFHGEQRGAAAAIHRLSTALRARDTPTVCRLLISSQFIEPGAAVDRARVRDQKVCERRFGHNDEYTTVGPIYTVKTIQSVHVTGSTATVRVVPEGRKQPLSLPLAKLHGHWIVVFRGD